MRLEPHLSLCQSDGGRGCETAVLVCAGDGGGSGHTCHHGHPSAGVG
jgi:hypothetical protein